MSLASLSVVVPCFNEQDTLEECIKTVLMIASETLQLEIIIVDDASSDRSPDICVKLQSEHPEIVVLRHEKNQGKGAALRTGIQAATHEYVAVQDADLEYDPHDLVRLLEPLQSGKADVVLGSRFKSGDSSRVLYFWHSMGNRFLTLLSNMFTDLNLTDMETCYKVFKREIIQSIDIKENQFGFEPEVVAKVAELRCRVYEMGISYHGRTYAEGKKIGIKDGFRALYCIVRYNAHKAPLPIQFLFYLLIGGTAAIFNLLLFLGLRYASIGITTSSLIAFAGAAALNYALCTATIFRRRAYWSGTIEILTYSSLVVSIGILDAVLTNSLTELDISETLAKIAATATGLVLNFTGRKYLIFREKPRKAWLPSKPTNNTNA